MPGRASQVIPCPVWDFVFQNLNTTFSSNVRRMPNTPFNEAGWLFPSSASSNGECDSYVKFNITSRARRGITARCRAPPGSIRPYWETRSRRHRPRIIYQHETTNDADGQPLAWSFTTGYFYIAEGEEFAFVDQIYPDFKFGSYGASPNAQVQLSFNVVNYPSDTPTVYGPYTATSATQVIATRFRGRQMSITVQGSDLGSFTRLGKVRYRYSLDGRR
jgi:hypothetical protein